MSKYIDSEKLNAEITKMQFELNAAYRQPQSDIIVRAISLEYDDVISLVNSLQQEQPEVDLEKEIEAYLYGFIITPTRSYFRDTIRHFYELGLKARKEE